MGCDIHPYLETVRTNGDRHAYCWAELSFGRDYTLFGFLAQVRNHFVDGMEPKGMPPIEELSWRVKDQYYSQVNDELAEKYPDEDGWISEELAQKYIGYGSERVSQVLGNGETRDYISNPDWHSDSWLSLEELVEVRSRYQKHTPEPDIITVRLTDDMTLESVTAGEKRKDREWKRIGLTRFTTVREIDSAEAANNQLRQHFGPLVPAIALNDVKEEERNTRWAEVSIRYNKDRKAPPNQDLNATIAAMRALKSKNVEPRFVFWFDN